MTRRLEAGPLLVTLGALLLLVSLFLSWFTGEITAWESFEVWDLVLFVLALGAIVAGLGLTAQDAQVADRRFLPAAVVGVAVIVASQIIDPPPAAAGQDPDTGAWLALGAALVMCAGAVLTFGRVHMAVTVEGREPRRRRVAAVDARGPADPTTDSIPAVRPPEREGGRLFARHRVTETESETEPVPAAEGEPAGNESAEQKQD
jgi:peptidoglycan/LPS O-acetylase OafA/YrhL